MNNMPESNSDIDYELITKFLAGEASGRESIAVETWISSSEENQQSFKNLKAVWEHSGRIIPHEKADVDVEKGWVSFLGKIEKASVPLEPIEKPLGKGRSLFYYVSRVAALLLVGIVFYLLFTVNQTPGSENQLLVTTDNTATDTLPDGSVASLNIHSQLEFPGEFNKKQRAVSLRGEAFFKVLPDPQKPFLVQVEGANIEVLGTSFYVHAHDTSNFIIVGVEEGRVKVSFMGSEKILQAGEKITINKVSREVSLDDPYNPNDLFWKSQTLIFQNNTLFEVFQTLERNLNIQIETVNPELLNCRLTGKFYGENVDEIVDIINTNFNLTSKSDGGVITFSGSGCNE